MNENMLCKLCIANLLTLLVVLQSLTLILGNQDDAGGQSSKIGILWFAPNADSNQFTLERDSISGMIDAQPDGSLITVYDLSRYTNTIIHFEKVNGNRTWHKTLFGYRPTNEDRIVSGSVIDSKLEEWRKLRPRKRMAKQVIYVGSSKTTLEGDKEVLDDISYSFKTTKLKSSLVFSDGVSVPQPMKSLATDENHVFPVNEGDKLLNILKEDSQFWCDTDSYFDSVSRKCRPCRSVCSDLSTTEPKCESRYRDDCKYFADEYARKNALVRPSTDKDIAPSSDKDVPPSSGKDVPPSSGKDEPPSSGKDVPPSSGKDVPPSSGKDEPPSKGLIVVVVLALGVAAVAVVIIFFCKSRCNKRNKMLKSDVETPDQIRLTDLMVANSTVGGEHEPLLNNSTSDQTAAKTNIDNGDDNNDDNDDDGDDRRSRGDSGHGESNENVNLGSQRSVDSIPIQATVSLDSLLSDNAAGNTGDENDLKMLNKIQTTAGASLAATYTFGDEPMLDVQMGH